MLRDTHDTVLETPDDFQRVMEGTRGKSATRPMRCWVRCTTGRHTLSLSNLCLTAMCRTTACHFKTKKRVMCSDSFAVTVCTTFLLGWGKL